VGWFSRSYGQKKETATESSSQWKWPRKKDPQTDHHLNSGLNSAAFLRPPPCPPETQGPHPKDTKTSSTLRIFTLCPLTLENRNWPRQGLPDIYIYTCKSRFHRFQKSDQDSLEPYKVVHSD
jgi:hypothetical protein